MNTQADGQTLLVGEGDFSFCVAMVNKLSTDKHDSITATSLETDDSIKKHLGALENIEFLKKKGVTVRLNTDATQLHSDPFFLGKKFVRIIFNFPHAGGKSNHKKNRKLLNDFFISAAQILTERAQVLMTLCKGQGGTPADKPRRAWQDSWQVVSMAANADLILVKVLPFDADEYQTYSSTGFRSQDKGFHTDNAITHMFEKADRVDIPSEICMPVAIHGKIYSCPRYTYNKLLTVRSIKRNDQHPLNKLYGSLVKLVSLRTEVSDLGMLLSTRKSPDGVATSSGTIVTPSSTSVSSSLSLTSCSRHSLFELEVQDTGLSGECAYNLDDLVSCAIPVDDDRCRLICDQFQHIADVVKNKMKDDITFICYYPVFLHQKHFTPSTYSFTYHAVIVKPLSVEISDTCNINMEEEHLRTTITHTANNLFKSLNGCVSNNVEMDLCLDKVPQSVQNLGEKLVFIGSLKIGKGSRHEEDSGKTSERNLGVLYFSVVCGDERPRCNIVVRLDLAELTCAKFGITDRRLLWSKDYRVLEQFVNLDINSFNGLDTSEPHQMGDLQFIRENVCDRKKATDWSIGAKDEPINEVVTNKTASEIHHNSFICPSLYPLTCSHDMSFWENETVEFDENKYFDVIMDVADDHLTSVELIDTFTDPCTGRGSRCYRLTFQSADQAMSYNTTWKLQSIIRLEVEKHLKITLR